LIGRVARIAIEMSAVYPISGVEDKVDRIWDRSDPIAKLIESGLRIDPRGNRIAGPMGIADMQKADRSVHGCLWARVVTLGFLTSWSLGSDRIDYGFGKPGQIVGFAARDKMPIDDHRGIDPQSSGVDKIIFDTERSGRPHPPIDICRDRQPTPVADRRDALFGVREVADKFLDFIEASQAVGHETSGEQNGVKIRFVHIRNGCIGCARIAVFSRIDFVGSLAGDDHLGPIFDQPKLRVPKLQVFVDVANESQNASAGEFFIVHKVEGFPNKVF